MRSGFIFAAAMALAAPAVSAPAPVAAGADGFDFQHGSWTVHHRLRRASGEWVEFEGDCNDRPILGGLGNIEDNIFYRPEGITRGAALRTFDPKTGEWAIWWVDGRNPHAPLDPAMKGKFVDGVGTFYADGIYNGRQTRTRFIWSHITKTTARWEQAFSYDEGKTWDTNWVMDFTRKTT
jgi:hypothetical protein